MPAFSLLKTYFVRGKQILQQQGPASLARRIKIHFARILGIAAYGNFDAGYRLWLKKHPALTKAQAQEKLNALSYQPLISIIVPVYNVEEKWLSLMIASVRRQSYPNWQLCLVDDCSTANHILPIIEQAGERDKRIVFTRNPHNCGIAITSNKAAELANGEYLALLDHDDTLHPDALIHNIIRLNQQPQSELIYSDEDKIDLSDRRHTPFFKPDFNLDLLRSQNYLGHFIVIKRDLFDAIGGFHQGFDGAQDYDLLLRACEKTQHITHIPKVLYHWRQIPGSTAQAFSEKDYAWQAGEHALAQHCARQNIDADITLGEYPGTYDMQYKLPGANQKVSIIIPFKDKPELLDNCLNSIIKHNHWHNIEIIAIDNQSTQAQTFASINKWKNQLPYFNCLQYDKPFNFAAICNHAAAQAQGEYLLFMNNDIEITSDKFIEAMLQHAARKDIGAVGAKLLYPNNTIQHAGIVMGINDCAGHAFKHFPASHPGYFLRLALTHNVSAVTAALMMISKQKFNQVNGFDDENFAIAFNDIDLCLKLNVHGLRNIYTPACHAIHHESISRGEDTQGERALRFAKEKNTLQEKWPTYFEHGDPLYNRNLSLVREDYSLDI